MFHEKPLSFSAVVASTSTTIFLLLCNNFTCFTKSSSCLLATVLCPADIAKYIFPSCNFCLNLARSLSFLTHTVFFACRGCFPFPHSQLFFYIIVASPEIQLGTLFLYVPPKLGILLECCFNNLSIICSSFSMFYVLAP